MERIPVVSSNIRAIGYEPDASTLEIEFHNGTAYQYTAVPQWEYEGLMAAESKGSYFNNKVKDRYPWNKL